MTTSEKSNDEVLEDVVSQVIDTFKFHGITLTGMEVPETNSSLDYPLFKIQISKSKRYRSLEDTLTLAYWTLWTVVYGEHSEDKTNLKIKLEYKEVN